MNYKLLLRQWILWRVETAKKVRGFVERLQSSNDTGVHTNKLPSTKEDEAMLHMDLCLDYMEIVDKALVDEVPKIFIMMLVMKTTFFTTSF